MISKCVWQLVKCGLFLDLLLCMRNFLVTRKLGPRLATTTLPLTIWPEDWVACLLWYVYILWNYILCVGRTILCSRACIKLYIIVCHQKTSCKIFENLHVNSVSFLACQSCKNLWLLNHKSSIANVAENTIRWPFSSVHFTEYTLIYMKPDCMIL